MAAVGSVPNANGASISGSTLTLQPGKSATFRFRVLIRDAHLGADELQQENRTYAGTR